MDQISVLDSKPGLSHQPDLQIHPSTTHPSTKHSDEPMEAEFVGPPLPPQFIQRFKSEIPSDPNSKQSESFDVAKPKKHMPLP